MRNSAPFPRILITIYTIGLIVALVGGALLWSHLESVAVTAKQNTKQNTRLVCALGEAFTSSRITQRAGEGLPAFRQRVKVTRHFVARLNKLDDCDPARPHAVRLKKKDREKLKKEREQRQGGGASTTPSASSLSGPSSGGSSSSSGSSPSSSSSSGPGKSNPPNFPGHVCQKSKKNKHC